MTYAAPSPLLLAHNSAMFPLLAKHGNNNFEEQTRDHVNEYADKGLRTLILAYQEIYSATGHTIHLKLYNSDKERKGMMIPNDRNPCHRKAGDAGISSFGSPLMLGSISDHAGTSSHDPNCKPQKPPRDRRNLAADHHRPEQTRRATNWVGHLY
ncbi:hypothetical protein Cgig2_020493 [Carnegiea gigantea]|uniref:Uncharacterized protein n=1 Tax=Carnegiea gigantea TaxID=171969 RepID=A0A9Q1KBD7_9CARY|nr:hypothetical protein Cgig2_020493 [Carnegiea gigantea]